MEGQSPILIAYDGSDNARHVLASRGPRDLRTLMPGSVAHQVVHHAHQPVLVVPAPALVQVRPEVALERGSAEAMS